MGFAECRVECGEGGVKDGSTAQGMLADARVVRFESGGEGARADGGGGMRGMMDECRPKRPANLDSDSCWLVTASKSGGKADSCSCSGGMERSEAVNAITLLTRFRAMPLPMMPMPTKPSFTIAMMITVIYPCFRGMFRGGTGEERRGAVGECLCWAHHTGTAPGVERIPTESPAEV